MKKVMSVLVLVAILLSCLTMTAYADPNGGTSLDDIVTQNQQNQTTQPSSDAQSNTGKSIISDLGEASKMDVKSPEVERTASGMKRIVSFIVQLLAYVITFGLTLRVVLDLMYIAVPFLRTILANGHIGNPQAGAGAMPGQQTGMMGGMGLGGMGTGSGGGFGGFGMNRGPGMMGGGMMQQQQQMPGILGKIQFVSHAALNAVAAETTVGPDGRPVSPMKIYIKDMIVVLTITPILLVLAISGALTELGFLVGELLSKAIGNVGSSL